MRSTKNIFALLVIVSLSSSCQMYDKIAARARVVNNFEKAALSLAKENRELKATISSLTYELESTKSQKSYLEMQYQKDKANKREIASISPLVPENDLVKYEVYRWKPEQLLAVGYKEFEMKNYEKSAQFFQTFLKHHGKGEALKDSLLFQSGLASYESGAHFDWACRDFAKLIEAYPASPYYKGAKLWLALAQFKTGNEKDFFNTVEEFRKKYRNTKEWEVLKTHYDTILQKYKK